MSAVSPLAGFDAAAARYDDDERGNPVLVHMRARAYGQLEAAFARGAKLIELGSGTGTESARLVRERACRVALVDPSSELLARASAKIYVAHADGLIGAHAIPASAVATLVATYGSGSFDGAFSSFGPLNCEPSLGPVAQGLEQLVRPGGALVLSIINRWCPAEMGWFALHGDWREASRRWGGPVQAAAYAGGPKDVRTWYYSHREIELAFAAGFDVEHVEALPLLWPPPYLDFLVTRFPALVSALRPLDIWASTRRGLRELGDHVLVRLRRR
jgi:SAM-dependent methyltransferase